MSTPAFERTRDLVVEVFVRDLDRSLAFYEALGFQLGRRSGSFAVLSWEGRQLFLDEQSGLAPWSGEERVNVRIMVSDVDASWELVRKLDVPILKPIADREYGLRDFTIRDPDGFGLRFASEIVLLPVSRATER